MPIHCESSHFVGTRRKRKKLKGTKEPAPCLLRYLKSSTIVSFHPKNYEWKKFKFDRIQTWRFYKIYHILYLFLR